MARDDGPRAPLGRATPDGRAAAVVVLVAACIAALALVSGGRVLTAEPREDTSLAEDYELARALAIDAVDPAQMRSTCIQDGEVELRCLDDGVSTIEDVPEVEVATSQCREATPSLDPDCLEDRLDITVPEVCRGAVSGVDVACLAGRGVVLVLDPDCPQGEYLARGCVQVGLYGIADPDQPLPVTTTTEGQETTTSTTTEPRQVRDRPDPIRVDFLGWLVVLGLWSLAALVIGLLVGVAIHYLLQTEWVRERRRLPPPGTATIDAADTEHDREVMAESLAAGASHLDTAEGPRAAIIACYAALLVGLEACAQGRRPAETADEHLGRVLEALAVRPEPLRELTTLFGEARFSDHVMTEAQRDRARAALADARVDLDRVTVVDEEVPVP